MVQLLQKFAEEVWEHHWAQQDPVALSGCLQDLLNVRVAGTGSLDLPLRVLEEDTPLVQVDVSLLDLEP